MLGSGYRKCGHWKLVALSEGRHSRTYGLSRWRNGDFEEQSWNRVGHPTTLVAFLHGFQSSGAIYTRWWQWHTRLTQRTHREQSSKPVLTTFTHFIRNIEILRRNPLPQLKHRESLSYCNNTSLQGSFDRSRIWMTSCYERKHSFSCIRIQRLYNYCSICQLFITCKSLHPAAELIILRGSFPLTKIPSQVEVAPQRTQKLKVDGLDGSYWSSRLPYLSQLTFTFQN